MKSFSVAVLLACALVAFGENDDKYRPTELSADGRYRPTEPSTTPAIQRATTTRMPYYGYNEPRQYGWNWNTNRRNSYPNDRHDPRYDTSPRIDSRFNTNVGKPAWNAPRSYHDYRTIRLDEKVDARGYRYVYETVGGILAEEVGTFENIGLKNEGVRTQGYVQITDPNGISYRIDYQSDSKEAYIPRNGEAPRTPPTIVQLLSLLESHK